MFISFLIMLREGFEAALIVGIIAGYLAQTGRKAALPSVWLGAGAAIATCALLGTLITLSGSEFPQRQQEIFAGAVGFLAVVMLVSMVFWMRRAGRTMKQEIHGKIEAAIGDHQGAWNWALAISAFLITGREGVEAVVFLIATLQQGTGWSVPSGAVLGLLAAAVLGFAVFQGGMHLDMRRFFRWTGIFIIFVAGGLVASSLVHFHEAGLWNIGQLVVVDLSNVLPSDSLGGVFLGGLFGYRDAPTLSEILAFLLFTIPTLILFLVPHGPKRVAQVNNVN
jgi:high-affinity iron transporter